MEDIFNGNAIKSYKNTFKSDKFSDKELTMMNTDELKSMQKPIYKEMYKANHRDIYQRPFNNGYKKTGRPRKDPQEKALPTDRLICPICGGEFTRYNRSSHNKTKVHMAYANMNDNMRKLLIEK